MYKITSLNSIWYILYPIGKSADEEDCKKRDERAAVLFLRKSCSFTRFAGERLWNQSCKSCLKKWLKRIGESVFTRILSVELMHFQMGILP